jgi:hypothetical protein
MPKSDVPIYAFAVLVGICAGILDLRLHDVLITALFVLVSTLALGFIRPRRPWRWILVVAPFVPLLQLMAYLLLNWKPYRAQIWECYCGALARLGVDELVRK